LWTPTGEFGRVTPGPQLQCLQNNFPHIPTSHFSAVGGRKMDGQTDWQAGGQAGGWTESKTDGLADGRRGGRMDGPW